MSADTSFSEENVPMEDAINRVGFGLYSYLVTSFTGVAIISFVCIGYGSTILVPASACELNTTAAQQGLLAAAPVIGLILGSIVWGYLADTRGRRSMLLVALLGGAGFNMVASISVNWLMLMIFQFIASLFASGVYSMSMSLLSESVPMVKRNLVVLLVASIFLLAQGIMAVLAIPIIPLSFSYYLPALGIYWNSWRTLILVYSMPSIITALWLFFMQESPKFVFSKGDEERTLLILRNIHKINNLTSKRELQVTSLLREQRQTKEEETKSQSQVLPLFQWPLLKYTLIMTTLFVFQQIGAFLVWLPTVANQFVRILETGEGYELTLCDIIAGSLDVPVDPDAVPCSINVIALLIVLAVGAVQSVVNLLLSVIVNKAGRRNIVMVVTALCGISGIAINLVPNAIGSAVLFGIMLLGIVVVGMYTAIAVSLFPTHLRALAMAIPMCGGRVGTFASIQILNLLLINNCDAGFYIFCAIFASSAIVASFLPDDRRLSATAPKPSVKPEESSEAHKNNTNL